MKEIVLPLAILYSPIGIYLFAHSMFLKVFPIPFIIGSIAPYISSKAIHLAVLEESFDYVPVVPDFAAAVYLFYCEGWIEFVDVFGNKFIDIKDT